MIGRILATIAIAAATLQAAGSMTLLIVAERMI